VKRAILPAAISDTAVNRWLAEAERREQPFPRGAAGRKTERDDHHEQNSAYSPLHILIMVPLAQSAERWTVDPEVTGSSPVRHPKTNKTSAGFSALVLFFDNSSSDMLLHRL
jgi:hypothetical protein